AHFGELVLRGALLVLQLGDGLLALFQIGVEGLERGLLLLVLRLDAGEGLGQRRQVERGALAGQLFAAALGLQALAVEVVDTRALDVAGARGLGLLAGVRVVALLPVGQRGLGVAQGVLAHAVLFAQPFEPRLGFGDGFLQRLQARLVAVDVLADLGQRGLGLVAGALQALGHLALVGDLLLDAGEVVADFVAFGLRLVERFHRLFAAHAAGLDLRLGLALLGDQLLQARLFLRQAFAQRGELLVEAAVFERLPLGVADLPLGLDRCVLLGLLRLPRQVLQLLADLVAQVGQAVEVLAGVADAGFGFLAPLLVLGDAGGLLQ